MARKKSPHNKPIISVQPPGFNVTETSNEDWITGKTAIETFSFTAAELRKYRSTNTVPYLTIGNKVFYYRPALGQVQSHQ